MAQIGQAEDVDQKFKDNLRLTTSKIQVKSIIDGQTLLVDNDRILYLPAIYIPWETPQSQGEYGVRAKQFLEDNLKEKFIRIYQVRNNDRALQNALGHEAAYIVRDDGWFAQGELVEQGLAFAYPSQSHYAVADMIYNAEAKARDAKIGFWADDEWGIHTPETIEGIENKFAIVEGQVQAVASRNNVIYINFGENWRDDFTVAVDSGLRRDFSKVGINVMDLAGKIIRARGWVRDYNGVFMDIFHSSQIEVMPE